MITQSYNASIRHAASLAPDLSRATEFIKWAEDIADVLTFIFSMDYDTVTEDLVAAAKEDQDFEDNE